MGESILERAGRHGTNGGTPYEDTHDSDINAEIEKTTPPLNQIGLIERSNADLIFTGIDAGFKGYFDGIPAVMSLKHGYQFDINNPNAYFDYSVRGKRSASMGSDWEQTQFDRYRGIELNSQGGIHSATGGMNKGNIHMERMATDPVYANKHTLNREFYPFRSGWMRDSVRGGGPVGIALNIGGSVYDYSPWGNNAHVGYASTDFASNIVTDLTLGGASTVVGVTAGLGAAALTGAAMGSVFPGVGTLIGLGVGNRLFIIHVTNFTRAGNHKQDSERC